MSKISTQDRTMIETWHKTRLDGNQRFTGKTDSDLSLKDRTEKAKWIDNNVNMALHGYSILGKVRAEFSDNDFSRKFEIDFRQAKSINPDKSLGYFLQEEIERISAIMWAIETCLDGYREHDEHVRLDNYLNFLRAENKKPDTCTDEIIEADLICAKKYLQVLHGKFDGEIWESVELNDFYLAMNKEPKRKLTPKGTNKKFVDWLEKKYRSRKE